MSHTPGPWNVGSTDDKKEVVIVSPHPCAPHSRVGYQVARSCYAWDVETGEATTETLANARLIAAAPDLLAALQGLMADITEYQTINKLGGENNHWQVQARAAIAKATGEA